MKKLVLLLVVVFCSNVYSQLKEDTQKLNIDKNISKFALSDLRNELTSGNMIKDSSDNNKTVLKGSKKSPGLAFIYSLFIPGMGQLYTKRFDVGKYYLISEAALWLGYASFTIYGKWLLDDAYDYSVLHAGVNKEGKDNEFFVNIGNYSNVDQYNNEKLQFGEYDKIYDPQNGYGFYWDNEANRKKYREDRLAGDRIHNDRLFIVGAILINHVVSAISAIVLTNNYNSNLKKAGGFDLRAGVIKHFDKVDGLNLKLTKWF